MIIYDLEIQKCIQKGETRLPEFKYCDGFHDFFNMGVACVVTYDTARREYRLYDEYQIDDLKAAFQRAEMIAGFNILKFDNQVLKPYDFEIAPAKCYDLLAEIARADGTPDDFKGLSLGALCRVNFGIGKTGDGALAPKLYQQGRFGELFDYCLADVRLTVKLLDRIIECGHVINPRNNKWLRVNRPR